MKYQLGRLMKKGRVWVALAICLLMVLPFTFVWLNSDQWWEESDNDSNDDADYWDNLDISDENMEHYYNELMTNRCPARLGKDLKDYWSCLWTSSITAKGLQQHERIMWDNYVEHVNLERELMEQRYKHMLNREGTELNVSRSRRVRRQLSPGEEFEYQRTYWATEGNRYFFAVKPSDLLWKYKACLQGILPGVSIQNFIVCTRQLAAGTMYGVGLNATFKPTSYPRINYSEYNNDREFKLLKMTDRRSGTEYQLRFDFQPLNDEEKLSNFHGADPYLEDNWNVYRYRFNNLASGQRQPGWSYGGLHAPKEWHKLKLDQFYQPLTKTADVSKSVFVTDLVQSYPAIGDIAEAIGNVDTPLETTWNKDRGYSVYTRLLLPLLRKDDIAYYKSKGLISEKATIDSDADQIQNAINALEKFMASSEEYFVEAKSDAYGNVTDNLYNPKFKNINDEDLPNAQTYFDFMTHFFGVDFGKYRKIKVAKSKEHPPQALPHVRNELQTARDLLRAYVDVVKTQEACVKAMVDKYEYRLDDENAINALIEKARNSEGCVTADSFDDAVEPGETPDGDIDTNDLQYKVTEENLKTLYDYYFDRKEARQSYSLPHFPVQFPICKHREPSPVNIIPDRGRESSLQDYVFGDAAYRLNRFFMFFPLDGSPLLTVGIVDGERLDDSSVQLTGGAVKGHNLTFQYMHIRFSNHWKEVGSEHRIDGVGAPMEFQMVFTIAGSADPIKYWHVLSRVQNQLFQFREKLVIIISVLVDVLETEEAVAKKIEAENTRQDPYFFEPLAQAAYHFRSMPHKYPKLEQPRGYVSVDPVFRFIDYIPRKSSYFYTYRGSLSWPPCFGYVVWSVYNQRLYISKRQFDQFRKIPVSFEDSQSAGNNIRKMEDIYVEAENDPHLTFDQKQQLKRLRTIDRHVLVGFHDVSADRDERDGEGVVGEEMYYSVETSGSRSMHRHGGGGGNSGMSLTMLLVIVLKMR